jgi:hypothetical protein
MLILTGSGLNRIFLFILPKIDIFKSDTMKNGTIFLIITLLFEGQAIIIAQPSASMIKKKYDFSSVDSQIQQWVDKGYYPGVSVLIAKNNAIIINSIWVPLFLNHKYILS